MGEWMGPYKSTSLTLTDVPMNRRKPTLPNPKLITSVTLVFSTTD